MRSCSWEPWESVRELFFCPIHQRKRCEDFIARLIQDFVWDQAEQKSNNGSTATVSNLITRLEARSILFVWTCTFPESIAGNGTAVFICIYFLTRTDDSQVITSTGRIFPSDAGGKSEEQAKKSERAKKSEEEGHRHPHTWTPTDRMRRGGLGTPARGTARKGVSLVGERRGISPPG